MTLTNDEAAVLAQWIVAQHTGHDIDWTRWPGLDDDDRSIVADIVNDCAHRLRLDVAAESRRRGVHFPTLLRRATEEAA